MDSCIRCTRSRQAVACNLRMTWHGKRIGSPAPPPCCSDVDIVTLQNPFDHLYRDSDVEGMTDGHDSGTAYGEIYGIDDPSMVRVSARWACCGCAGRRERRRMLHSTLLHLLVGGDAASLLVVLAGVLVVWWLMSPRTRPAPVPLQGWSRYAQGTRHMAFNSGLFFVKANDKTIDLMTRIAGGCCFCGWVLWVPAQSAGCGSLPSTGVAAQGG